jgi:hypothetical protein
VLSRLQDTNLDLMPAATSLRTTKIHHAYRYCDCRLSGHNVVEKVENLGMNYGGSKGMTLRFVKCSSWRHPSFISHCKKKVGHCKSLSTKGS